MKRVRQILEILHESKDMKEGIGLLVSKTQWGASSMTLTALWSILPQALAGDPVAIGQAVSMVVGWLTVIYGRLHTR